MSGALERLEEVREDMRKLERDLATQKRYFDSEEVARQVRERVSEKGKATASNQEPAEPQP